MMDIQEITREIQTKLNHVMNAKVEAYIKQLVDESEEYRETQMSQYITELTFDISSKIIKERVSKINPKPVEFTFILNRAKYFEQTINDLTSQVNQEVYFDAEIIKEKMAQIDDSEPFTIKFKGHFLKDYGFIGTKDMVQKDEITMEWFPAILSCMRVNDGDTDKHEEKLTFLRNLVAFGFTKALEMEYVFIDVANMNKSLATVDTIIVGETRLNTEEFYEYREHNILDRKKKSSLVV